MKKLNSDKMKSQDLDLHSFREPTLKALKEYSNYHENKLTFGEFQDYRLTPEKSSTARTLIPCFYNSTKVGEMCAIVFLHGDGTGDESTYKIDDIIIPDYLRHIENKVGIIPRSKSGIICEAAFPLFTIDDKGRITYFAVHLQKTTAKENPTRIVEGHYFGRPKYDYIRAIELQQQETPGVYFTIATDYKGKRYGDDPHATYFGLDRKDIAQVAGFLSVNNKDNKILEEEWKFVVQY